MVRLYDVSQGIRDGGLAYPGDPPIRITEHESIAAGSSANVSALSFGSHTGTHVDAPLHFIDGGAPVDAIPLGHLIGPAILVRFEDSLRVIRKRDLEHKDLRGHPRVLLATRNSALLRQREFQTDYTYLSPDGAEYLASIGVVLVGIDYLSVEQFHSGHHRTHLTLLERGIVIVEGLDLSQPMPGEYELMCLPLKLVGRDGAPARAVLRG
ncbi:MAG: cyclase family protein [Gemmatimonadaceae bacterium]